MHLILAALATFLAPFIAPQTCPSTPVIVAERYSPFQDDIDHDLEYDGTTDCAGPVQGPIGGYTADKTFTLSTAATIATITDPDVIACFVSTSPVNVEYGLYAYFNRFLVWQLFCIPAQMRWTLCQQTAVLFHAKIKLQYEFDQPSGPPLIADNNWVQTYDAGTGTWVNKIQAQTMSVYETVSQSNYGWGQARVAGTSADCDRIYVVLTAYIGENVEGFENLETICDVNYSMNYWNQNIALRTDP